MAFCGEAVVRGGDGGLGAARTWCSVGVLISLVGRRRPAAPRVRSQTVKVNTQGTSGMDYKFGAQVHVDWVRGRASRCVSCRFRYRGLEMDHRLVKSRDRAVDVRNHPAGPACPVCIHESYQPPP